MNKINRFLYISGNDENSNLVIERPFNTFEEALALSKREFEASVKDMLGPDVEIEYDADGSAEISDDCVSCSMYKGDWCVSDDDHAVYGGIHTLYVDLSDAEIEAVYRYQLRRYRIQDAEAQFFTYVGIDPYVEEGAEEYADNEVNGQLFADKFGFTWDEAINESSDHYLLDAFVDEYEHDQDCNCAENDMWQACIDTVLMRLLDC